MSCKRKYVVLRFTLVIWHKKKYAPFSIKIFGEIYKFCPSLWDKTEVFGNIVTKIILIRPLIYGN